MSGTASIIERPPTVAEYLELIASVGWLPRERRAVEMALANSLFAVCALVDDQVIGCGRVIGDGGLHLYLADVIVSPAHQRRGVGTSIVAALTRYVESVPYSNLPVAVLPTRGLANFYAGHGFKAQSAECPIMQRWINRSGPVTAPAAESRHMIPLRTEAALQPLIDLARPLLGVLTLGRADMSAATVACAIRSASGRTYTGVCVHLSCGIGFCAEHAAVAEMIKGRETQIDMIVAVSDEGVIPPCGRCRELMVQVDPWNFEARVGLPDGRSASLRELLPDHWMADPAG